MPVEEGRIIYPNGGLRVRGPPPPPPALHGGGGGASILFRVYEPLQTTANANNNTNPYPSASLAVRLPMALLAH